MTNNSKDKQRRLNLIGGLILGISFSCFLAFFIWLAIIGFSANTTRSERLLPVSLLFISLVPTFVGLALIMIAEKGDKITRNEGESRQEFKQRKEIAKTYKRPRKNRDPRLGEIAYWRIEEQRPETNNPFEIDEISLSQPSEKEKD